MFRINILQESDEPFVTDQHPGLFSCLYPLIPHDPRWCEALLEGTADQTEGFHRYDSIPRSEQTLE